jgi:threonine dehydratase
MILLQSDAMQAPQISNIRAAAKIVHQYVPSTPLLESHLLNQLIGGRLLIKGECLQRTGSFKFRGAINKLSNLTAAELKQGVVAYSSGNHAQGVAEAARLLGTNATIIMPDSAPKMKKANTLDLGAKVIEYDIATESREQIGLEISEQTGAILVRPYDDVDVIAGQGSVGLEFCQQMNEIGAVPDQVICPCGGGGLIAGVSIAVHNEFANCDVYAAEPQEFDDTARSLLGDERVANSTEGSSICDAIITPMPGEITFAINRNHIKAGLVVSDTEVLQAMRVAFERLKIVVEPGGAVALAAALSGKLDCRERTTVVVCSGGNVDPSIFARCLTD